MATNEPKKRSITGNLVANMLTECEDDFTLNITYVARRFIDNLCQLAAKGKSKFTASELRTTYNDLMDVAKDKLYSASTVEFGFVTNSLGVDGAFIGPKAKSILRRIKSTFVLSHSPPTIITASDTQIRSHPVSG